MPIYEGFENAPEIDIVYIYVRCKWQGADIRCEETEAAYTSLCTDIVPSNGANISGTTVAARAVTRAENLTSAVTDIAAVSTYEGDDSAASFVKYWLVLCLAVFPLI